MIIRNNLASVPVVNFSLYFIACLLLIAIAAGFTIFNVRNLAAWYSESSRLHSRISEQQGHMAQLQSRSSEVQDRINKIKTPRFVSETEFFNEAIQRRIFSWTRLFDQFEKAFPENVRMISIYPTISGDRVNINMEVVGKSLKDNFELVQILQNSPIFSDVVFRGERSDENGFIYSQITLKYLPEKVNAPSVETTGGDR